MTRPSNFVTFQREHEDPLKGKLSVAEMSPINYEKHRGDRFQRNTVCTAVPEIRVVAQQLSLLIRIRENSPPGGKLASSVLVARASKWTGCSRIELQRSQSCCVNYAGEIVWKRNERSDRVSSSCLHRTGIAPVRKRPSAGYR